MGCWGRKPGFRQPGDLAARAGSAEAVFALNYNEDTNFHDTTQTTRTTTKYSIVSNISLNYPTADELERCMKIHEEAGDPNKNQKLRKLFELFPGHTDHIEVKIKCVAINSIYNTAIRYIDPIAYNITEVLRDKDLSEINATEDWIILLTTFESCKARNARKL
jgi:hypothetical protein